MPVKVQVVFYSLYGHVYRLAEAIAEGRGGAGAQVELFQVAETLPEEVLEKMGAADAKKAFAHVPVADPHRLAEADAIILGTPTRYGGADRPDAGVPRRHRRPLEQGALIGKVGSAFTSTASQHGGQETTLLQPAHVLLPPGHGVAGVPYAAAGTAEPGRDHRAARPTAPDHRRPARRADADGERAGHRPLPGQARRPSSRRSSRPSERRRPRVSGTRPPGGSPVRFL